jgi:hypothetical protein
MYEEHAQTLDGFNTLGHGKNLSVKGESASHKLTKTMEKDL